MKITHLFYIHDIFLKKKNTLEDNRILIYAYYREKYVLKISLTSISQIHVNLESMN